MAETKRKPRKTQAKKQPAKPRKKVGNDQPSPTQVPDYWLNKRQVCDSLSITATAFDKWRVEPVARVGNSNYYDVRSLIDNRVDAALRKQQLERPTPDDYDGLNPVAEQARLAKEKADSQALKNQVARGELIPAGVAGVLFGKIGAMMASALDALPANIKRRVPSLTATDMEFIKAEIVRAQNAAADVDRHLDEFIDDIECPADPGD